MVFLMNLNYLRVARVLLKYHLNARYKHNKRKVYKDLLLYVII